MHFASNIITYYIIHSAVLSVVSLVLVSRMIWSLCQWPCWLKTPSHPPSPCESHHPLQPIRHCTYCTVLKCHGYRSHVRVYNHFELSLRPETTRWCKQNLVGQWGASQPWSTPVTLAVWWSSPSEWVTSTTQPILDLQDFILCQQFMCCSATFPSSPPCL